MAKFTGTGVERIEYQFSAVPHISGEGFCKGAGVIPEPDQSTLDQYYVLEKEFFQFTSNIDTLDKIPDDLATKRREMMIGMLEILKIPRDHLDQLPPRYLDAFRLYVTENLSGEVAAPA
jgi:hypothetical protein